MFHKAWTPDHQLSRAQHNFLVDHGPFADNLASYAARSGNRSTEEVIDGRPARIVSFDESDGTRVVAAHFDGLKTRAVKPRNLTNAGTNEPPLRLLAGSPEIPASVADTSSSCSAEKRAARREFLVLKKFRTQTANNKHKT
jgi:hypothetical protein